MKKLLLAALSLTSCSSPECEKYVLPENYTGKIVIYYNKPTGEPIKYDNKFRVYHISKDGILRTQFKLQQGIFEEECKQFNVYETNKPIKHFNSKIDTNPDKLYIFNEYQGFDSYGQEYMVFYIDSGKNNGSYPQ